MPDLHLLPVNTKRVAELEAELLAARDRIKELEARLETDPVLNVLNRRGFERELRRALAYANRHRTNVGVLHLAIDNCKDIVASHGRLAVDAVLIAVCDLLVQEHRASDIIARFGDSFMVLLWNADEADARTKTMAIETKVNALDVRYGAETFVLTGSAGLTMLKRFDSADSVVARVETDMRSKRQSRLRLQSEATRFAGCTAA